MTRSVTVDERGRVHNRHDGRFITVFTPEETNPRTASVQNRNAIILYLLPVFPPQEIADQLDIPLSVVERVDSNRRKWGEFA